MFLFIIVFGGISTLMLLIKYDFNIPAIIGKPPEKPSSVQNEPEEVETPLPTVSGKYNFLIVGFDDNYEELRFVSVVNADMDNITFNVLPVPSDVSSNVGGRTDTLLSHYRYGGLAQLELAVEKYLNINICRHAAFTDDGMKNFIRELGEGLVVNPNSPVEYRGEDFSLSLSGGEQAIAGDTIMEYMRYPDKDKAAQLANQADLICRMLDQYISYNNVIEGEALFVKLINTVRSDITIADYNSASDCLQVLVKSSQRKPSRTADSAAGFVQGGQ